MIDKLSTILFSFGLLLLICTYASLLYSGKQCTHDDLAKKSILIILSVILISTAWVLREYKANEKYSGGYNYAYQNGLLVGGTVYAAHPENAPGLGWIL